MNWSADRLAGGKGATQQVQPSVELLLRAQARCSLQRCSDEVVEILMESLLSTAEGSDVHLCPCVHLCWGKSWPIKKSAQP